jgi:hypothetical protein
MTRRLQNKSQSGRTVVWTVLAATLFFTSPAKPQDTSASSQKENTMTGAVVSSTRSTLVVKGENGQYQLFGFDRYTVKPRTLTAGSTVRVVSTPGDQAGFRVASQITLLKAAPAAPKGAAAQTAEPVPREVRNVERDIKREAQRYHLGVRAGVALDPELVLLGVHAQLGPFFNSDIFFRPNVEFAYGEVTALFALNAEVIYRLPVKSRQGRWSPYFGVGPGFSFLHQNFEQSAGQGRNIDFGQFHSNVGLNILGGMRSRSGVFLELKTSVYSDPAPVLRFIIGYNF